MARSLIDKVVSFLRVFIVTCGGLGFFPRGSGTVASFFALGFWLVVKVLSNDWIMIAWILVFSVIGALAIQPYEKQKGAHDSSEIVIDEWVGMGISLLFIPMDWRLVLLSFVLFRVFDITKPWGVKYFDENYFKGWGVMLDDVIAGIYTLLIVFGISLWLH